MEKNKIILESRIKIARDLNTKYNVFGVTREENHKKWKEILAICDKEGIDPILVQVTPDVFGFLVSKSAVNKYFI